MRKQVRTLLYLISISAGVSLYALYVNNKRMWSHASESRAIAIYAEEPSGHDNAEAKRVRFVLDAARSYALASLGGLLIVTLGMGSFFALMLGASAHGRRGEENLVSTGVLFKKSERRLHVMKRILVFGIALMGMITAWAIWLYFARMLPTIRQSEGFDSNGIWLAKSCAHTLWRQAGMVIGMNLCATYFVLALNGCVAFLAFHGWRNTPQD